MLGNWIKQSTTTSGTGNLTLSSVTGYDTFASQFGDDTTNTPYRFFNYIIKDGNNWEYGVGHMSSTTVLVRDICKAKFDTGTYSRFPATKLSLSGSAADVFCDLAESHFDAPATVNQTTSGVPNDRHGEASATVTLAGNYTFGWPMRWSRSVLSTGIRTHCTTAGGGTKWQMGLYAPASDGKVGKLIARTGDVTPATGDTTQSWNGGNKYIEAGWYWLVWSGDGAPVFTNMAIYGYAPQLLAGVKTTGLMRGAIYNGGGLNNPLPADAASMSPAFDYSTMPSQSPGPLVELVSA